MWRRSFLLLCLLFRSGRFSFFVNTKVVINIEILNSYDDMKSQGALSNQINLLFQASTLKWVNKNVSPTIQYMSLTFNTKCSKRKVKSFLKLCPLCESFFDLNRSIDSINKEEDERGSSSLPSEI